MKVNDRHCSFYYIEDDGHGEIGFDSPKTALLVVDMQNGFVRRPRLADPTPKDVEHAERWEQFYLAMDETVIPNNARLLEAFRSREMSVNYAAIVSQKKDGSDRALVQRSSGFNNLFLPLGSHDAAMADELAPRDDELVFMKTTDSAVAGTNMAMLFRNMGIDTVVVSGVYTDQCVSGTVRSLADEIFKVWLVEDATRGGTQEITDFELSILNNIYCHVVTTDEVLSAL